MFQLIDQSFGIPIATLVSLIETTILVKHIKLIFILALSSCTQNIVTNMTSSPRILAGEGIFLMDMRNIKEANAFDYFDHARDAFAPTNSVKFLQLEEYELLANGIRKEALFATSIEDTVIHRIAAITESRYLLLIDLMDKYHNDVEATNNAELLFKIVDTKGGLFISEFKVNTTINPLEIPDEDDEPILLNTSNTSAAVFKAFKKGIRHIRKGIVTN